MNQQAVNQPVYGTPEEKNTFKAVLWHYQLARQDLLIRYRYFDRADQLFRSYIDESTWPYRSVVFDPRTVTALFEKTARILANKPKGRLLPRSSGDTLGAKICNELLDFQIDDNERADNMPWLGKWNIMDLNARKYGTSFGLCSWKWQQQILRTGGFKQVEKGKAKVFYDGPNFKPLNNRDCLPNPGYSSIQNWFQYRSYPTLQELEDTNDAARSKPIYKNLDILKAAIAEKSQAGGDTRTVNYTMKNLSIRGLTDLLGKDPVYKTIEVITEYRPDRWITFSPRHGVVLRDIPNPYDHGQIPVVMLRYYPVDEDIYGLSEIEPIERLQKALNALICQYLDAVNMSLYTPIKVRNTGGVVQMHTLEFGPGKKWLMNDPSTDVVTHQQDLAGVQEFTQTYRFLVGALMEGLGESSSGISNLVPGQAEKTATEVRDLAGSRSVRDNFNSLFLGDAIQKQMMFWHKMDQQFYFSSHEKSKVMRVIGKDSIRYFKDAGLDGMALDDDAIDMLVKTQQAGYMANPKDVATPMYPSPNGSEQPTKFSLDESGQFGKLIIEKEDLEGDYDYIADMSTMSSNATDAEIKSRTDAISMVTGVNPKDGSPIGVNAMLQQAGVKVKVLDLVEDYLEDIGMRDAQKYFEQGSPPQPMMGQPGGMNGQPNGQQQPGQNSFIQTGAGGTPPGGTPLANG